MERVTSARLKVLFIGSLIDGGFAMAAPVGVPVLDHLAALSGVVMNPRD
jgi:hypothetical protein